MSETVTIDLPPGVADAISDAAKATGVSPEAFILEAATARALDLLDAKSFFAERAKDSRIDGLKRVLGRRGGRRPQKDDERS